MTRSTTEAWANYHEAKGRVEGAMAVLKDLRQPELAEARRHALGFLEEAGEAYAEAERVLVREGRDPESLRPMNQAFWTWAHATLLRVSA